MNYYRRYVGNYLKKTARLSMLEHGAYNLMLDYYYADEKPLSLDKDEIYLMVRAMTPADRKAVDKVLNVYFKAEQDGYHNARADHEIEVSEKARENGNKGGRPPAGSETGNETGSESGKETRVLTGNITEGGGGSGHPPNRLTSNRLTASRQPSTSTQGQPPSAAASAAPAAKRKRGNGEAKPEAPTAETWAAYASAYENRYHVPPTRNAKVNGMLARFCERIPHEEAPAVAAFFVGSNRGLYVSAKHAVDLLLRDAEGLRTEWATGRRGTDTAARQADKTAATGEVFTKLIAEADEQERAGADWIYPEKLSQSDRAAAAHFLNGNPKAQLLLDELAGVINGKAIRDPVAILKTFVLQAASGVFVPSHAPRIQAEREAATVRRELQDSGRDQTGARVAAA